MAIQAMIPGPHAGLASHVNFDMPETLTQTFKTGALLVLTAGYVAEAGANPSAVMGISLQPGQNLAASGVPSGLNNGLSRFYPALPHCVFEATLDKASALGYALLQTDLGVLYGVTKSAGGIWYIDIDKTGGNARCVITGFRDPVGTVSARVYAMWKNGSTGYA